jgi:hypothetical protein
MHRKGRVVSDFFAPSEDIDVMIVPAGHALVIDQCVHDRFLGCLDDGSEDRIETIVRNCFNRMRDLIRIRDVRIGG